MIWLVYPQKDATLYEGEPTKNTGIDSILEISHTKDSTRKIVNSRSLIKFDTDIIQRNLTSMSINFNSASYYLQMAACEQREIDSEYTIYAYPLSGSWDTGYGKYFNTPKVTKGVSWKYRFSQSNGVMWEIPPSVSHYVWDSINDEWVDANFYFGVPDYSSYVTSSYTSSIGGGTWYYGSDYEASQSFSYTAGDLYMNVSNICRRWISTTAPLPNDGFILKMSSEDETFTDVKGVHQFFSKDSNTIFLPRLHVCWRDYSYNTGSNSVVSDIQTTQLNIPMNKSYQMGNRVRLRLQARDRYPTRTYSTSSFYTQTKVLPSSSYYEIRDGMSEYPIIPFNESFTQISCDSTGSYFDIWLDNFQPERFYRILIKMRGSDYTEVVYDNNLYFKVTR